MPSKKKSHRFVISITFNKPIGKARALQEARNCIHGGFYPTQWEDSDPGEFRVRSITRLLNKEDRK